MMAEDNESSSDKCESDSGKPEKMFTLKKWNAVAMWSWDVECDICAICRVQVMDACLRCQAENKREVLGRQDCVVVWGECNHSFHHCCMSLWVKQNNRCPLCQQEWSIQRMGNNPEISWRKANVNCRSESLLRILKLAKMNVMEPCEHLLALKVMRLTRPTLVSPQIIMSEAKDLPQNIFHQILENDATSVAGSETIAAGQFMLLPQSFGNIYLGETFSSYICVHNCTPQPVDGVTVKADLQSNTTRISLPLHEKKSIPATLNPDDTLDDVIHHEVKEIGTHILVCEVHYTTPAGLPQSFRKFFKFQVLKPLDVKTKFYSAETDEVYLEAQIQNITAGPICLEKVELDSSEHYTVSALNTLANGESVFTAKNMLQPKNSCQFLYCIKPIPEITKDIKALKAANNIGKLDIVWRSNLGERGRLQTSQLQRVPIEYNDLRLIVTQANNIVKIGEPFTFICRVTNTCDRPMELTAKLDTKPRFGCDYTGSAEFDLGTIDPGNNKEFPLTVCPAKLGLIKITNLLLTNTFLKRTYEFDDFVQVFVVDSDYFESDAFQMNKFVRYDVAQTV